MFYLFLFLLIDWNGTRLIDFVGLFSFIQLCRESVFMRFRLNLYSFIQFSLVLSIELGIQKIFFLNSSRFTDFLLPALLYSFEWHWCYQNNDCDVSNEFHHIQVWPRCKKGCLKYFILRWRMVKKREIPIKIHSSIKVRKSDHFSLARRSDSIFKK